MVEERPLQLERPIFIGGAGSSGSSLLATVLNRHPDVFCGSELSLFNKADIYADFDHLQSRLSYWLRHGLPTDGYFLYAKLLPHRDNDVVTEEVLLRCVAEAATLREFVDRIQIYCLQAHNKTIYAEKTPSNAYCFRQLAALYPDCSLVHPIRDGRDVVCSLKRRGYGLFEATSMWLYNTAAALAARDMPGYSPYHYEDLARAPQDTLLNLCQAMGIAQNANILEPNAESDVERSLASIWNNSPTETISTTSIGRHRDEMDEESYALFCSVRLTRHAAHKLGVERWSALDLLQLLNYDARPPRRSLSWLRGVWPALRDHTLRNARQLRHYSRLAARLTTVSAP